jgi:tetratricopeptide (TPR) repeat protein
VRRDAWGNPSRTILGMAAADVQIALSYSVDDRIERLRSIEANLNRVLSESPNNAWAHYLMGGVLVQTNRQAQAISESERALALNPDFAPETQMPMFGWRIWRSPNCILAPTRTRSACIAARSS